MSLNDPHWGRSSDEEKKNDRGDNEQRSDGARSNLNPLIW